MKKPVYVCMIIVNNDGVLVFDSIFLLNPSTLNLPLTKNYVFTIEKKINYFTLLIRKFLRCSIRCTPIQSEGILSIERNCVLNNHKMQMEHYDVLQIKFNKFCLTL